MDNRGEIGCPSAPARRSPACRSNANLLRSGLSLQLVTASKGRLKRLTVYVTLGRMEEKGYVVSTLDNPPRGVGGLPRRIYAPTALGRRMLSTWTSAAKRLVPEFAR
jgi:hypothetical protein